MGSSILKIKEQTLKLRKNSNLIKMAFYIYEQPAFSMEHFHPGFHQPLRSLSSPRHWHLLEKLFDDDERTCQSSQSCCSSRSANKSEEKSTISTTEQGQKEVEVDMTNQEDKSMEPVAKTVSKRFMVRVSCQETMEKVEIKIQFGGHKFKAEKFDVKEEDIQTLIINIPKDVKVTQVPIAMDE